MVRARPRLWSGRGHGAGGRLVGVRGRVRVRVRVGVRVGVRG